MLDYSPQALKFREAVYCAIGISSHDLYDYLNFDDWVRGRLVEESQRKEPEWIIIRRRIALVISNWVSVKSAKENRHLIYQILLLLLQPGEDLVVRITAVSSLRVVVDDFDFESSSYQPYIQNSVDCLMSLLREVDEFDSKMKIINCLIVIIERMDGQVI